MSKYACTYRPQRLRSVLCRNPGIQEKMMGGWLCAGRFPSYLLSLYPIKYRQICKDRLEFWLDCLLFIHWIRSRSTRMTTHYCWNSFQRSVVHWKVLLYENLDLLVVGWCQMCQIPLVDLLWIFDGKPGGTWLALVMWYALNWPSVLILQSMVPANSPQW